MLGEKVRVVVTGMGAVTPFGNGVKALWASCREGRSCIDTLTCFDTEGFLFSRGGQVPDADRLSVGTGADRAASFMQAAVSEAFGDAGLSVQQGAEGAVVLATNFGGACAGERLFAGMKEPGQSDPEAASEYYMQTCADRIAADRGLSGARVMLSLSCASGTAALCYAADLIRMGRAEVTVAGGYDALSRFAWSGLCALRAMTKDEIRPFDRDRAGTIFSEGAGALILESAEHARKRGAPVLAEILGGWMNNNAYHLTAPAKEGAGSALVMKRALEEAGISAEAVDHIDAHGTGTKYNDVTETQAIKTVFGAHAGSLSVTSLKSMTGHLMGAAGAVQAIAAIQGMKHGIITPTINFQTPDPECDLDYVLNAAREKKVTTVLSNSAGIGGCNAAIVLRRGDDLS